jgi:MFS family permease
LPHSSTISAGQSSSSARSLAPLFVLFLVNVLNFYDRQALGAILEPLRREFRLSDTQLGLLTTSFTVVYALAGVPLGRLADTWRRKRLLAMGTAVWAALTGLGGLAAGYGVLLFTRLGVGVGEAVCAPAATSWIGDVAPAERRARAMAWFMMAVPVGGMLSFAVTGPVAQAHGWRVALALAALPAAALIPALLLLREPLRASGPETVPGQADGSWAALWKIPAFWWMVASGAVVNFVLYSFSTFLPAFLTRFHGLTVARAGLWTGIGTGVAGIAGALAAGWFGDRVSTRRGRARMRLSAGAALAAAPLAFLAIRMPAGRAAVAVPLLMAAYGLLQSYYGLVYAAMQDIVGPGLRGAAMGTYFMAMYLCGASFGPVVTGGFSDRFARMAAGAGPVTEAARALGLREAMYLIPALCAALAAVLWAGARTMDEASPPESGARP